MANPTIGFIGLGIMGKPMARNLMKAGYPLVVHNRSRAAVDELSKEGAQAAAQLKGSCGAQRGAYHHASGLAGCGARICGRARRLRRSQTGHALDRHVEHIAGRRAEAGSRCPEARYGHARRAGERRRSGRDQCDACRS